MGQDLKSLWDEVNEYTTGLEAGEEGEHLWDNYQRVVSITLRLQQIHNDLANREILGVATPEEKKFRTLIVDPTIDRFDKLAQFESRKITAKGLEIQLEK